jgi:hypothetical protein
VNWRPYLRDLLDFARLLALAVLLVMIVVGAYWLTRLILTA